MSSEEIQEHELIEEIEEERERHGLQLKPILTLSLEVREDVEVKKGDVLVLTLFHDSDRGRVTCSLSVRNSSNSGSFKRIGRGRIEDIPNYKIR